MQESYGEGVASHTGPESCMTVREDRREAWTGERAGRVWSRENGQTSGRRRPGHRRKAISTASRSQDAGESCAVGDPEHVRTHLAREPGEPWVARRGARRAASGSLGTHADDERPRAVGQARSTDEVSEQRPVVRPRKRRREGAWSRGTWASSAQTGHRAGVMCTRGGLGYAESVRGTASAPETRAGCGSAARPDLRRGRWATTVPTPTIPVSRSNEAAGQIGNGSPVIGANTAVVRGRRPPPHAGSPFGARAAR